MGVAPGPTTSLALIHVNCAKVIYGSKSWFPEGPTQLFNHAIIAIAVVRGVSAHGQSSASSLKTALHR